METAVEKKFSEFYEEWMGQLEGHLRLLLVSPMHQDSGDAEFESVVNRLTAHHKDYYKVKWAWAQEDVLAFFTPVWLCPLEKAHLWMTGWKPSMAFRLVKSLKGGGGLSEEQARGMEVLRVKIKAEEERVEREMERQQVALADRKMVQLARSKADAAQVEEALKGLLAGLEKVMKMADCVRLKTMKGVMELLTPMQCVQFLAATSLLHIQMRKWGNYTNNNTNTNTN